MNDDEKSVTILDPSGYTYFMDGAGNISVTAPNDINFTAGANLNISVGQDINQLSLQSKALIGELEIHYKDTL